MAKQKYLPAFLRTAVFSCVIYLTPLGGIHFFCSMQALNFACTFLLTPPTPEVRYTCSPANFKTSSYYHPAVTPGSSETATMTIALFFSVAVYGLILNFAIYCLTVFWKDC